MLKYLKINSLFRFTESDVSACQINNFNFPLCWYVFCHRTSVSIKPQILDIIFINILSITFFIFNILLIHITRHSNPLIDQASFCTSKTSEYSALSTSRHTESVLVKNVYEHTQKGLHLDAYNGFRDIDVNECHSMMHEIQKSCLFHCFSVSLTEVRTCYTVSTHCMMY